MNSSGGWKLSNQPPARREYYLVLGRGGAGRSSVATALALAFATSTPDGPRPSVDLVRWASTGESRTRGVDGSQPPSQRDLADLINVREITPLDLAASAWKSLVAELGPHVGSDDADGDRRGGIDPFALDARELIGAPGCDAVMAWREIFTADPEPDSGTGPVVIDLPPMPGALDLVTAPRMFSDYVQRVWPRHRRLAALTSGQAALAGGALLVDRIAVALAQIVEQLEDRAVVRPILVLDADRVGAGEVEADLGRLHLAGYGPVRVIVNRRAAPYAGYATDIPHPAVRDHMRRERRHSQALAALAAELAPTPVIEAPMTSTDVTGSLQSVLRAASVRSWTAAGTTPSLEVQLVQGSKLDSEYELSVYLPNIDPRSLDVGRVEDDVVIAGNGIRRRLRLPSGLRRCRITGARWDRQRSSLVIAFVPDERLWPK